MATKIICIAVAAVVIVALRFMADKFIPRGEDETGNAKD